MGAHATPQILPTPNQRFAYFQQINTSHKSILKVKTTPNHYCHKTNEPCEAFGGMYCKRMEDLKRELEGRFLGRTVICFSHAASVALVAAFLNCHLDELKFAPCGIYHLRKVTYTENGTRDMNSEDCSDKWELVSNGKSNDAYVSQNSPTTYPWGFEEHHFEEDEGAGVYHGSSLGIGMDYFIKK